MDRVFFELLKLPYVLCRFDIGSVMRGEQTGKMLIGIEKILHQEYPDFVLVQGDTNKVLTGAIAAVKLGINVEHVEVDLRSYNRKMPEETNYALADNYSD